MKVHSRIQTILKHSHVLFWCAVLLIATLPGPAAAPARAGDAAKAQYLAADKCLKQLKKSPIDRQKVSAWLNCINRYESIYTSHPTDSWAPAGMFKAAELYLQLFQLSKNPIYQSRADDLLTRIRNKYPDSAYRARAKNLKKALTPASRSESHIKVIKSKGVA